jgi:hypothetical protein
LLIIITRANSNKIILKIYSKRNNKELKWHVKHKSRQWEWDQKLRWYRDGDHPPPPLKFWETHINFRGWQGPVPAPLSNLFTWVLLY